jgi:branched-chain amino acid transport system ATP-binding protein
VTRLPAHRAVAEGIVLVPEGRAILGRMTVEENLRLAVECRGALSREERDALVDEQCRRFPILGERRHQPAALLSGGQQQMLAIARAWMARPRLMLLDEPSLGLAPLMRSRRTRGSRPRTSAARSPVRGRRDTPFRMRDVPERGWPEG